LLTLLQPRQPHKPLKRLNAKRPRQQGFSLAVVLVSMLAVLVSSVALANRTQTGLVTASISGSNREAREVADAGIAYILSEWNRPANRGIFSGVQPMGAWRPSNTELTNNCNTDLTPTSSATTDLASGAPISLGNNRSFRLVETMFITDPDDLNNPAKAFTTSPNSNTPRNQEFQPDNLSEIELVVEGIVQRGSTTNTALARQRLQVRANNCGSNDFARDGLFTYGGITPGTTPSLNRVPRTYVQGASGLVPQNADKVECTPIVPTASVSSCANSLSVGQTTISIIKRDLSPAARAGRNPPTIQAVVDALNLSRQPGTTPITVPTAIPITRTTTIDGNQSNCFVYNNAAHCNVSSINLSGNSTLTVNTTSRPVYLYITGSISLSGNSNIIHTLNRGSEPSSVEPSRYTTARNLTIEDYRQDTFRFQIRGTPATNNSSRQNFSFSGTPTSSLLFWAPAADLSIGGTADFSSALYVNSFSTGGNAFINLIGTPGGFTDLDDDIKSFATSSATFTRFF
jgi:hypothetical protein